MKYITLKNIVIALAGLVGIMCYTSYVLYSQIQTLGIDAGTVLAQSGILEKTENGEIIINRVVTVADLQAQQ